MITTSKTLIITAIKSFTGNPHDSKTIEPLLDQLNSNLNYSPKEMVYDRGGKEQKQIGETQISTPDYRPLKRDTEYQKRAKRKKFRRRAAIEPVIGHLKADFRMGQNLSSRREIASNQCFFSCNGVEFKENDETIEMRTAKKNTPILFPSFSPKFIPKLLT